MSSIDRSTLSQYLHQLLDCDLYQDYAPNGLQVEGPSVIQRVITGVTACQALIDKAIMLNADAILVHHGYFWKGEKRPIVGAQYARIAKLIRHDINLFAYHLPLDGHAIYGNNVQLAKRLDWPVVRDLTAHYGPGVGLIGQLEQAVDIDRLKKNLDTTLNRDSLVIAAQNRPIQTLAWCTGGAQDLIEEAIAQNCDAYISGEVSEKTFHQAKEANIHYICAGHHATERYGIQALGTHVAEQFKLDVHFVDIDNPV